MTHLTRIQEGESSIRAYCEKCHHFMNEEILGRGLCAHVLLIQPFYEAILSGIRMATVETLSDKFEVWIDNQIHHAENVCEMNSHGESTTYLCIPNRLSCITESTSRVSICCVKFGQSVTARCNSVVCIRGKNKHRIAGTKLEDHCCCHLSLLFSSSIYQQRLLRNASLQQVKEQLEEQGDDELHDHNYLAEELDDLQSSVAEQIAGGSWNETKWECSPDCSPSPILLAECKDSLSWRNRRCRGSDLIGNDKSAEGYLIGHKAFLSLCLQCNLPPDVKNLVHEYDCVVHTELGSVLRPVCSFVCSCGNLNNWNPASEFIHTINQGRQGGQFRLYHLSILCIDHGLWQAVTKSSGNT